MLEAGDTIDRYRIVRLLGRGGMGEVYLADDTELHRRIALKLFSQEEVGGSDARDHLVHEARAASALSHPNVCTVFEVGDADGQAYIAMEYVEGRTLDALIAGRDLPVDRVARYGAQIAAAIAHAHENGVIHRDLKSANVVVTDDGRAKVLDFGLASTGGDDQAAATRNVTSAEAGRVSGTLPYMAPETLRGQPADARSDVWALGVILYEATTGRLPFTGETAFEVSTAIMKEDTELPATAAPGLAAIIRRCLQKAPGERYQSAAEVRAALETLQSGTTGSGTAVAAEVEAAVRASGPPRWLPFAAAFSVVAVIALAGWVFFGAGAPRATDEGASEAIGASGPAVGASGRPTIAVFPFRDRTGVDELAWLAEGVPSMLVTSLAQTEGLDVVSESRVHQIVGQLGREALQDLDVQAVEEFARRSGAGAVVTGGLYHTGTDYRIDVQVEDITSGRVLNAHSVTGPFVFPLVDELAESIRAGLELDAAPATADIAAVTSDSLEAWRHYEEGLTARANVRYGDAVQSFQRAIDADPGFVLAYFQLASFPNLLDDPSQAEEYEQFVLDNMDRVPERDRLLIEGMYAYERDRDPARAERILSELVRRHPDHEIGWVRLAEVSRGEDRLRYNDRYIEVLQRGIESLPASGLLHNQLGYAFANNGRYPEAVRAIERYVELNPEEPNAHDSLAEMYILSGQPQVAFDKYGEILEFDPQWFGARFGRAMTAGMLGRFDVALEEIDRYQEIWIDVNPGAWSVHGAVRAMLLTKLGQYDEALATVAEDRRRAAATESQFLEKQSLSIAVHVALESGDLEQARSFAEELAEGLDVMDAPGITAIQMDTVARTIGGVLDVRTGGLDQAEAILSALREDSRPNTPVGYGPDALAGELALARDDPGAARDAFRRLEPEIKAYYSASIGVPTLLANNNVFRDGAARTLVAEGDIDAAISEYRDLLKVDIGSKYNAFLDPRYVLRLAELLDQAGRAEEAREQYLRFAELWEDADDRFQPAVRRARERAAEIDG